MQTKRIVLVDGAHLLSEMLQRIFQRTDNMEVVASLSDFSSLPKVIDQKQPDWVIFSQHMDNNLPEEIDAALRGHPNLCVLTIKIDTGDIKIDWFGRQNKNVKITTVEGLVKTLRRMPVMRNNSSPG